MNDPSAPSGPQHSLPPLTSLIKPEQVSKLTNFDERNKAACFHGVSRLWEQITSRPPDSQEYQIAHKKLAEVTSNIRTSIKKYQADHAVQAAHAAQAAQATQGAPTTQEVHTLEGGQAQGIYSQLPQAQTAKSQLSPAHVAQQTGTAPPNQGQQALPQSVSTTAPSQSADIFSAKVIQAVQSQSFIVPPHITQQGPEQDQVWLREARLKFARYLQKREIGKVGLQDINKTATTRQKEGRPFTTDEATQLTIRKNLHTQAIREAEDYITKFRNHQAALKAGVSANPNHDANQDPGVEAQNAEQAHVAATSQPTQQRTEYQGQPHTVSSALDAARNQLASGSRGAGSPSNAGQNAGQQLGHSNMNPAKNSQGQADLAHQSSPHVNQTVTAGTGSAPPQFNSSQNTQPNSTPQSATSQRPHPLSHEAAMNKTAQLHAQPNYQPPASQPSTHAHPPIGNREHIGHRDSQNPNNLKFPIPKELKVPQPTPIPMGPARPTLTGGPSNGASTSLSQPAVQKHPGYVLEGEGERVLSKKKLQELVRQVTGGGVESEEGETLSAEVEEVHPAVSTYL